MPPPSPPDPRFRQALLLRRQGQADVARAVLEELLAEQPDQPDALEVLGMLLSEVGELDRAIALTRHLAELRPDSIMAHANLSRFYMLKGDKETAEDWQGKARVLGWKEEVGRKGASPSGSKSTLDDVVDPALVARQEETVAADPGSVVARMALASSYRRLGKPSAAVTHLQAALELDPSLSALYLELGKSLEAAARGAEAIAIYQRGIPLADRAGDLMPRNQMASRLAALQKQAAS